MGIRRVVQIATQVAEEHQHKHPVEFDVLIPRNAHWPADVHLRNVEPGKPPEKRDTPQRLCQGLLKAQEWVTITEPT
jgi:hypothetical protein